MSPLAMSPSQPLLSLSIRPLNPTDFAQVRSLHKACFPIAYGDDYISMLCHHDDKERRLEIIGQLQQSHRIPEPTNSLSQCDSDQLIALALSLDSGEIAGMISAQIIDSTSLEDYDLLSSVQLPWWSPPLSPFLDCGRSYLAGYILTLGVFEQYRRSGVASQLISALIDFYQHHHPEVDYLFLHVLHSNTAARHLYERLGFFQVRRLDDYYRINGQLQDAFLYYFELHPHQTHEPKRSRGRCSSSVVDYLQRLYEYYFRSHAIEFSAPLIIPESSDPRS